MFTTGDASLSNVKEILENKMYFKPGMYTETLKI